MTRKYNLPAPFFILATVLLLCPFSLIAEWRIENKTLIIDDETDSIPAFQFALRTDFSSVEFSVRPDDRPLKIGDYAFVGCSALKSVALPDFVDELGEGCFKECHELESLILPANLRSTPRYMVAWCTSLSEVQLPDSVEKIGAHSFAYCESIEKISLPHKLKNIENNAFSRCTALQEILIPDSVTALESYAFSDCFTLRRARLPENDSLLGELIFSGCGNLKEIIEPSVRVPLFDCGSYLFEPDDMEAYATATLLVPHESIALYKKAPGWRMFNNIRHIREY